MLFHTKASLLAPGGFLGVDLFFVLSGFLITTLLLQEHVATGAISLRGFYARRGLRLLPAVLALLAVYASVTLLFRDYAFTDGRANGLGAEILSVLTYTYNWFRLDNFTPNGPINHLWSLSIEEQFYLLWPCVIALMLWRKVPPLLMMGLTATVATLSALMPVFVDGDYFRFYFGTDYRLQTLLTGSLLAQLYVAGVLRSGITETRWFKVALALAALALTFLVFAPLPLTAMLHGGMTLAALCGGVLVIAGMFETRNAATPLLTDRTLVYIGKRSYALYLWHNLLAIWLISLHPSLHIVASMGLAFVAAELSYRLVEAPALRLKHRFAAQNRPPQVSTVPASEVADLPRAAA
jgi:peptidoglycan/LPS O-acetylase OafA/YrhL